jgi:hypothetical protein
MLHLHQVWHGETATMYAARHHSDVANAARVSHANRHGCVGYAALCRSATRR